MQHAVAHEVGAIRAAIRRSNLKRYRLHPRNFENSIDFGWRRDSRVIEPTNYRTTTKQRMREAR
jgi:hypothetical protein